MGRGRVSQADGKCWAPQAGVHCIQYRDEVSKGLMEKESLDGSGWELGGGHGGRSSEKAGTTCGSSSDINRRN